MAFPAAHPLSASRLLARLALLFSLLFTVGLSAQAQAQSDSPTVETSATPSNQALADMLEDEASRKQIIEQLRAMTPEDEAKQTQKRAGWRNVLEDEAGEPGWASELASSLQVFGTRLAEDAAQTMHVLQALFRGDPVPGQEGNDWTPVLRSLLTAIMIVLASYLLLRLIAAKGFDQLNRWIMRERRGPRSEIPAGAVHPVRPSGLRKLAAMTMGRKLMGVVGAFVIDVAATLLASTAGYIALVASQGISLFAVQFLSAFVMIEVVKALSRGVFATRYEQLRLLPLSSAESIYWNRWLATVINMTGYGLLVVVPVTQAIFLPAIGQLLGLFIMLGVYIYAVIVVWKNRNKVRAGLIGHATHSSMPLFSTLLRVLAHIWHWIALAYFTVLLVVTQIDQRQALAFMMRATGQSMGSVLLGMLLAAAVTALLVRGIRLPEEWRKTLPMLEARLNAYVPFFLKSLRLLVLICVSLIVLDAWQVVKLRNWVESEAGHSFLATLFHVGLVLMLAALIWTVLASIIEHRVNLAITPTQASERKKTLLLLFRSAASITIVTLTVLIVLSQIGIDIGPLIAGAGVVGLAVGFGAQKLVQDVITGIFIQLENGMNQNDVVELADLFGTVEKITIRSVVIRSLDGGYHLIPFSTIDKLTNHTRDYGYHYAEYLIAHRENVDDAIHHLHQAFAELMADPILAPYVIEDISIPGVTSLNERGFNIRVLIKTLPGFQWDIQRGFNRLVKQHFDAAGIELPYPQSVVHFGRDKNGYAAPADLRAVESLQHTSGPVPAPGQTLRPLPESGA